MKKFDERLQKNEVGYDHKHILNTAPGQIPNIDIETINKGVTYEQLKNLNAPVYTYNTQITIHGIFPGNIERYCYGYQSLVVNKNQSLGVRWTAIDREKKEIIQQSMYLLPEKQWNINIDSRGMSIYKTVELSKVEELKEIYKIIPDIFFGDKQIWKSSFFQLAMLEITFNGIKIENLWEFISFLTEGKITNQKEFETQKTIKEKKEEEKEKQWREKRKKEEFLQDKLNAERKARVTEEINNSKDFIVVTPEIGNWYLSVSPKGNLIINYFYKAIGKMFQKNEKVDTVEHGKELLRKKDISRFYRKGSEVLTLKNTYYNLKSEIKQEKKEIEKPIISKLIPATLSKNNQIKITRNESKNGIEITFDYKPSVVILSILKTYHFKWSQYQKIWYTRYSQKLYETISQKLGVTQDVIKGGNR